MENIMPDIMPEGLPIDEVELLIFVLDGSSSMNESITYDNRKKADHVYDIVVALIDRLLKSPMIDRYRITLIYFSEKIYVEKEGETQYFTVKECQGRLRNPLEVAGGGSTAIAGVLRKSKDIIDKFELDESMPTDKNVTLFLFTDGEETIESKQAVEEAASKIKACVSSPSIATISFGDKADEDLLKKIASGPNERQKRHLDMAGVLQHLSDSNKLFLQGHVGGEITQRKAEVLKNFVVTLTETQEKE